MQCLCEQSIGQICGLVGMEIYKIKLETKAKWQRCSTGIGGQVEPQAFLHSPNTLKVL